MAFVNTLVLVCVVLLIVRAILGFQDDIVTRVRVVFAKTCDADWRGAGNGTA